MLRRVLLPLLVVCAAAAFAPGAFAAMPPCHPAQPLSLSSAHFLISFNGDPNNAAAGPAVSAQQAGLVLASAEQAYNAMTAMGFPAPAVTGSGKTEIHILDLASYNVSSFNCNGEIDFDSATIDNADGRGFSAAFDVFEEIEWGYGGTDGWLMQGAAAWAAWKSLGYPSSSTGDLGPWELSLDCQYTAFDSKNCSASPYENLGLSRWPFYEYLAERFGTTFMGEVLTDVQSSGDGLTGLQQALTAHGSSITAEYNLFAARALKGGWSAQTLNLVNPPVSSTVQTGVLTGDLPAQTFGVDHLASRVIQIDRGDGTATNTCYAATLTLTVTMPSGVTSQPVFIWKQPGSASVPLTVSGSTATASIPWDTCKWSTHGYLSLPNATTNVNAALFKVAMHLDVSKTEVTAKPPAAPANGYGNGIDVGSAQVAPLITVFGPLALHLPSNATRLRLVVEANAEGGVRATLGSADLGQNAVVPGENVLTYNLPAGLLRRLRTTSAANNLLTLSPVSQDGQVVGAAKTVKVVVTTPPPKPKKKKH